MYLEVENYKDFEDEGELVVECDEEFVEFAKEKTGIEDKNEAVEKTVNSILKEKIDEKDYE